MKAATTARTAALLTQMTLGAAGAVTLVTYAWTGQPGPWLPVALLAAALGLHQAESAAAKITDAERRRTHRPPLGNIALALYCLAAVMTAVTISPNPPPVLRDYPVSCTLPIILYATLLAGRWAYTSLHITVDERLPDLESPDRESPHPEYPATHQPSEHTPT